MAIPVPKPTALGPLIVAVDKYWGAQTQRSIINVPWVGKNSRAIYPCP